MLVGGCLEGREFGERMGRRASWRGWYSLPFIRIDLIISKVAAKISGIALISQALSVYVLHGGEGLFYACAYAACSGGAYVYLYL